MNIRTPATPAESRNCFRSDWLYRRLPAGNAMLAAGTGMSPAFFALLRAIGTDFPVSFADLQQRFPQRHADDLELWLSELCGMGLIAPADSAAAPVRVLMVHHLGATRLAWRNLLATLPLELFEAGSLEEADAAYHKLRPQGVILGPSSGDFDTLNLLHVLMHPRALQTVKILLVLNDHVASQRIKAAAACADDTVQAADLDGLAARVARNLALPQAVAA